MTSEEAPVPDFRGHSDLWQAAALGQVAPLNFAAGHKVTAEGFHHMNSSGGDPVAGRRACQEILRNITSESYGKHSPGTG